MIQDDALQNDEGTLSMTEQTTQEKSSAALSKAVAQSSKLLLELSGYPIRGASGSEAPRRSRRRSSIILGELVSEVLIIAGLLQVTPDRPQIRP